MTGMLFAWDKTRVQPVILSMPGSPHGYIPLFHSVHLLEEAMTRVGASFDSIKQVENGEEFYASLRENAPNEHGGQIKVIQDLIFLPDGRVRFIETKEN